MKVKVTWDHIAQAAKDVEASRYMLVYNCPVARAVSEATGKRVAASKFAVSIGSHYLDTVVVSLPGVAQRFITRFDKGARLKPIEFEIDYT